MKKSRLGKFKPEVSILGLGGFHQLEIKQELINSIVQTYVEAGGNYIETAVGYGNGASEKKIGTAVSGLRRDSFVPASKTSARDYHGFHSDRA
jgi:aryl-alcohol dehydrogenase-like predicted oxidoreductase